MRKLGTRDFMDSGLVRDALASREEARGDEKTSVILYSSSRETFIERIDDIEIDVCSSANTFIERDFNDSIHSLATIFRASEHSLTRSIA